MSTATIDPSTTDSLTDAQRRAGMRSAVFGQCAGTIGSLVFTNGLLLLYLRALGMGAVGIMLSLALHEVARGLIGVPAAHLCDRYGIKRVGGVGLVLTIAGYAAIAAAGFGALREWFGVSGPQGVAVGGIALYAVGFAIFTSGWFALLWGIVPADVRGRFFGVLRFAWQMVVIAFTGLTSLLLSKSSGPGAYQVVMALVFVGQIDRLWHYSRIPEARGPRPPERALLPAIGEVIRAPGYMGFCAYAFLLHLFASSTPALFQLVEADVLHMDARTVAFLGVVLMLGNLTGFAAGGWVVDRLGAKFVFLICHLGYGLVLGAFPLRGLLPASLLPVALGALNFGYGAVYAASTIAISTEMLALAPPERKSLSTGLCMSLISAGAGLSGLIASGIVASGMLRTEWRFFGLPASQYDSVLLMCAGMIVMLVVTLGLVPAVVGRPAWVPKGGV